MTWTLFICDGVSQYQLECESYPDLGAKDIVARMSDGPDCIVNPRFVVMAMAGAQKREPKPLVQQTLAVEDGRRRHDKAYRLRNALRGKGWRTTAQVMADLGAKGGREEQSILRALDRMVQYGEAERYPPRVEGRRMSRDGIEWRLREGSE
ncbi:MAG: hypothetical protein IKR86_09405 [Candidatus Methanomethylophilaceae archaeon]|nr:hypothetical protein [Candidatus Methanomethylophilaceae archaeon]